MKTLSCTSRILPVQNVVVSFVVPKTGLFSTLSTRGPSQGAAATYSFSLAKWTKVPSRHPWKTRKDNKDTKVCVFFPFQGPPIRPLGRLRDAKTPKNTKTVLRRQEGLHCRIENFMYITMYLENDGRPNEEAGKRYLELTCLPRKEDRKKKSR